jgi:hypothetical protein
MSKKRNTMRITPEQLYQLRVSSNRESQKEQGIFDGRFATKIMKPKSIHLEFRKSKHILKNIGEGLE